MEKKLKLAEEINYFLSMHDVYESSDYETIDVPVKILVNRNTISKHNSISADFIYPGHDINIYGSPRFNHVLIDEQKIHFISVSEAKPNKKNSVWFFYQKKKDLIRDEKIEKILN